MSVRRRKAKGHAGTADSKGKKTENMNEEESKSSLSLRQESAKKRRRMVVFSFAAAVFVGVIAAVFVSVRHQRDRADAPANSAAAVSEHAEDAQPSSSPVSKPLDAHRFTSSGTFEVLETVPHNTNSFTQGFCLHNGTLYEGTGLYGESKVQVVDIHTGDIVMQRPLADEFFGEGLAYYEVEGKGRLVQITWKEQTGFVYDATSLDVFEKFTYSTHTTEGWGITRRRDSFVVSDGSIFLLTWDDNFVETSRIPVTFKRNDMDKAIAISNINELEWDPFTDTLLANVWFQDVILRIDPLTGFTLSIYDLSKLYPKGERRPGDDVLNGIAITDTPNEVWVTGKLWPSMYRIRLID